MQRYQLVLAFVIHTLFCAGTVRADPFGPGNGNGPPWQNGGDWNGQCGWQGGNCDGNGSNGDSGNGYVNGNGNGSQLGFSSSEQDHYNRIITIHAALACLVWVFLIPLGGILIRAGLKGPWVLRIHALLQSISFLIYIVAAGCGVYLVRSLSFGQYSMWQDPHTKLGMAILVLAFFQPILGLVHHSIYKRRASTVQTGALSKQPGRTMPGYAHLWLGRVLIVLGMINGGLGLRLAASSPYEPNKQAKKIAYGVGTAIMGLLYFAFVIFGEKRRANELKHNDRSAIPLVGPDDRTAAPPTYRNPPSYEASQESIVKEAQTTARYG